MSNLFRSLSRAFSPRSPSTNFADSEPVHRPQPPKAPSPTLRLEALKILSRLELIPEFRSYLYVKNAANRDRNDKFQNPVRVLWDCFSLGKPLCVLLDLLGSPSGLGNRLGSPNGINVEAEESHLYLQNFIERLQFLEIKGWLSYGEVMRASDLWDGTSTSFSRVLRTVRRILIALEQSYPGLYKVPPGSLHPTQLLDSLVTSERANLASLRRVFDALTALATVSELHPCLQTLTDIPLVSWHEEILAALEEQCNNPNTLDVCDWQNVFNLSSPAAATIIRSHRAICSNWDWAGSSGIRTSLLHIRSLSDDVEVKQHVNVLLTVLPRLPARLTDYAKQLSALLDITLPTFDPSSPPQPSRQSSFASTWSELSTPTSISFAFASSALDPYDSLCSTLFILTQITANIHEMCTSFREIGVLELLKPYLTTNPHGLGHLLFDDRLKMRYHSALPQGRKRVDSGYSSMSRSDQRGQHDSEDDGAHPCSLFLFEDVFFCFLEVDPPIAVGKDAALAYPILPWEMGSACRRLRAISSMHLDRKEQAVTLQLLYSIPTNEMRVLRYSEHSIPNPTFEIEWADSAGRTQALRFTATTNDQQSQWCEILEGFVHSVSVLRIPSLPNHSVSSYYANESDDYSSDDEYQWYSEDEPHFDPTSIPSTDGRRTSHPRPWSLIARKGPRSETSSFIQQQAQADEQLPFSPGALQQFFEQTKSNPVSPSKSTGKGAVGGIEIASSLPRPNWKRNSFSSITSSVLEEEDFLGQPPAGELPTVLDLTGKIVKEGRFPEAHGGFSDIWKGVWREGGREIKVGVKVLRSKIDDPMADAKMVKQLNRELSLWSSLHHPNILPLLGTTTDFGHYESMVCPWLKHGSVSRYMERHGDILSRRDRLQLLCEVAEGLKYLHSFSIVHGDLSGANVLISDSGNACLGDFGLSSIVAEFHGTSFFTSNIGGAIRWADASLYRLPALEVDGNGSQSESDNPSSPGMGPWCDIYSFGSVMLELLSGRIPYHYIRSDAQVVIELHKGVKPRRPAPLFVTDAQWDFIQQCWGDEPKDRPDIEAVCQSIQALLEADVELKKRPSVRSALSA